jgi:hypothetical protein
MGHNHSMTEKYGDIISWPSHKNIDENMRAFVRQVRGGIQDSEGNKHAYPLGIPSVQDATRNLQGQLSSGIHQLNSVVKNAWTLSI